VRSRVAPGLVALVTLSILAFGQVCALHNECTTVESARVASNEPASSHDGCSSDGCGGEDDAPCTGCAPNCCRTWGPPTERLELPAPISLRHPLDIAEILDRFQPTQDRAPEVALFQLARPPSEPAGPEFATSLSRRGPPATS
jgi:hypothetical protein